jgi:hypothetical protein
MAMGRSRAAPSAGAAPMQPGATVQSNGKAVASGTLSPFTAPPSPDTTTTVAGPLTVLETGVTYLRTTRPITLIDASAGTLASGGVTAPSDSHAMAIFVGNIANRVATIFAAQIQPGSANRHVPKLTIPAGVDVYFEEFQLTTNSAEATQWHFDFA